MVTLISAKWVYHGRAQIVRVKLIQNGRPKTVFSDSMSGQDIAAAVGGKIASALLGEGY